MIVRTDKLIKSRGNWRQLEIKCEMTESGVNVKRRKVEHGRATCIFCSKTSNIPELSKPNHSDSWFCS